MITHLVLICLSIATVYSFPYEQPSQYGEVTPISYGHNWVRRPPYESEIPHGAYYTVPPRRQGYNPVQYYVPHIDGKPIYIPPNPELPVLPSVDYQRGRPTLASVYEKYIKDSLALNPYVDDYYENEITEASVDLSDSFSNEKVKKKDKHQRPVQQPKKDKQKPNAYPPQYSQSQEKKKEIEVQYDDYSGKEYQTEQEKVNHAGKHSPDALIDSVVGEEVSSDEHESEVELLTNKNKKKPAPKSKTKPAKVVKEKHVKPEKPEKVKPIKIKTTPKNKNIYQYDDESEMEPFENKKKVTQDYDEDDEFSQAYIPVVKHPQDKDYDDSDSDLFGEKADVALQEDSENEGQDSFSHKIQKQEFSGDDQVEADLFSNKKDNYNTAFDDSDEVSKKTKEKHKIKDVDSNYDYSTVVPVKKPKPSEKPKPSKKPSKHATASHDELDLEVSDEPEEAVDQESNDLTSSLDTSLRSLLFNPEAEQLQKFQKCITKQNETGNCMYVQHCNIPNIANSLEQLMNNVCVIENAFVGVCCPEFPVETIKVDWGDDFDLASKEELSGVSTSTDCGLRPEVSNFESWPWLAPLLSMPSGKIFCGGALINDHYVLTAAHCTTRIPRNQLLVRLGQKDITDPLDNTGEDYAVVEIKRHAQYNRRNMHNDLALLKLSRRVPISPNQSTVCLPDDDDDKQNDGHAGDEATLVGWKGISGDSVKGRLLEEQLLVMTNKECEENQGINMPKTLLCTEARSEKKRPCNADSGIPLVIVDKGKYEVIGILSWDRNDCDPRFPAVFTRVSRFNKWIRKHSTD